ncbi:MAG: carbohydrate ABC transporter permease, partial [Chloroflexaceae bacterium]|nr:carbohydrate ABC transporter permease [Chloroflexaceae bacterium]
MAVATQTRSAPVSRQNNARRTRELILTVLRYVLMTVLAILFFSPFILSFLGTFKSNREITAWPPELFPSVWRWENWANAWNIQIGGVEGNVFGRWLFNSLWLGIVNTVTQVFFCAMVGYGFARLRFPGKELIFTFILATMALPSFVTMIPAYVFYANLGWINTYWPLIVPTLVVPFGVLVMTQFFKSIPKELEEAAAMDGANRFTIFMNVGIPLARPALITLAILQFQGSWNNFMGPLLYLRSPEN